MRTYVGTRIGWRNGRTRERSAGHGAATALGQKPHISVGNNAIQFTDNPMGGLSAVTLGNSIIYSQDYGPERRVDGTRVGDHERQHTYQGELLGPLYLPSNILGGLSAMIRDGEWHGPHNWNEVGPMSTPPRPWRR